MLKNNEFKFLRNLTDDELVDYINNCKDEVQVYAAEEEMVRRATLEAQEVFVIDEEDTFSQDELEAWIGHYND